MVSRTHREWNNNYCNVPIKIKTLFIYASLYLILISNTYDRYLRPYVNATSKNIAHSSKQSSMAHCSTPLSQQNEMSTRPMYTYSFANNKGRSINHSISRLAQMNRPTSTNTHTNTNRRPCRSAHTQPKRKHFTHTYTQRNTYTHT